MRIAFIADWRSPIANNWVGAVAGAGYECLVLSTFPVHLDAMEVPGGFGGGKVRVHSLPIALAGVRRPRRAAVPEMPAPRRQGPRRPPVPGMMRGVLGAVSNQVAPYDLRRHLTSAEHLISDFQPALLHALRIPYEGMFAAQLQSTAPLVVSVWGNDFTLFARATRKLDLLTRATMAKAAGVIADCHVDLARAASWGLPPDRPTIVLPGGAGLDLSWADRAPARAAAKALLGIDPGSLVILNPRGYRSYVRTTEYCHALRTVAASRRNAVFLFADMAGNREVSRKIEQLGLGSRTILLPKLSHREMVDVFAAADVSVSPSVHDGTPNTLLESMAAGCLPVAGDIPSVREWIQPGVNGLLCDPTDPADVAQAVLSAITDRDLARRAAVHNHALVRERANRSRVADAADAYYRQVLEAAGRTRPAA